MLKKVKKVYRKIISTPSKDDVEEMLRSKVLLPLLKRKALESELSLTAESSRSQKIIVSLTSFDQRLDSLYLVLDSIARQTLKPDLVILWLSKGDFSDNNIPLILKKMKERGLTINYRKDVGPHTKLLYAVQQFKDDLIITVDDDLIYPPDMIEKLYSSYLNNKNTIHCHVAREIKINDEGIIAPYEQWERITKHCSSKKRLLPLGVYGVLYIPDCFYKDVLDINKISKLCPKADDIWFRMMSIIKDINVTVTGAYENHDEYINLDSSKINPLYDSNRDGGNDQQFEEILRAYEEKIDLSS